MEEFDDHRSTSLSPSSDQNSHLLRRRSNSISAPFHIPTSLILPRQSSSSATFLSSNGCDDLDQLISVKPLYTSLKDLLAVNSSMPNSPANCQQHDPSGSQISIRNRLVKQAAWAYLQPTMSTPTDSANRSLFKRIWFKFARKNPVLLIFRFFSRVFDCLFSAIRIRSCSSRS